MIIIKFLLVALSLISIVNGQCQSSITTVKGLKAPSGQLCSGQLIFEDNFDVLDNTNWFYENTMGKDDLIFKN